MTSLAAVLDAIKQVESGGNPNARSPTGAMGAYQFMPATAREFGLKNPYDEKEARGAAERKISGLLSEYDGDLSKALAAYNMGQGNLKKVHGDYTRVPETRSYVAKIDKILGGLSPVSEAQASEATQMHDLPEGFTLDETPAQTSQHDLPEGFTLDDAQPSQPEQAQPQQVMPFGLPTGFSQGANDIAEGIKANLEKKKIGLQQIGSDVARDVTGEVGQGYSPYREDVNARGRTLNRESKEGSLARKLGETLPDIASAPLLPVPEVGWAGAMTRLPANAGLGGLYAAFQPYDTPQDRIAAMGQGAVLGAAIPEGLGVVGAAIRKANPKGLGDRLAAAELAKQLEAKFGKSSPLALELSPAIREADPNMVGPAVPRFGYVPGVEPTAAMLYQNNPKIKALEQRARMTNAEDFAARDLTNRESVADALTARAWDDNTANAANRALNERTGQLRQQAFDAARGELPPSTAEAPQRQPRAKPSMSVDTEKDDLIKAIRKLGGINKSSAEKIHGNQLWEDTEHTPNPNYGPVWRNGSAGQSMDDLATELYTLGYLDDPDPHELAQALYHHGQGTLDASNMYSIGKRDFSELEAPRSEHDNLMDRLDKLASALEQKNAPKVVSQKTAAPVPEFGSQLQSALDRLRTEPGVRSSDAAQYLANKAEKVIGQENVQPEDLYQFRKSLDDALRSKGISSDELTNAAKSSRMEAVTLKKAIDEGLDAASGGIWTKYLSEHRAGMRPIEEGRSFQDILDRFDTKAPTANLRPGITPHALRVAENKETWKDLGASGLADKLGPQGRLVMNDAVDTMNAIEAAKTGNMATSGSNTLDKALNLAKTTPLIGKGVSLAQFLKNSVTGQEQLSKALLNPNSGDLAKIIKAYEESGKPPPKWLLRAYRQAGVAGANAGR
jgi:hypothetical protein